MFDGICILLALFLYSKAEEGYRNIAFFALCWFIVSDVIYHYFFLDIRAANNWLIYLIYSAVNVWIIYKLSKLRAALFINRVLKANVLLNIVASLWFLSSTDDKMIYNVYPYPAGLFMILVLSYLWMVSYGTRILASQNNNRNIFYRRICVCYGLEMPRRNR